MSRGARAGNLWPTGDLLERLPPATREDPPLLLLELTSSHLAFIHHSPTIAAVISFWPDHLELHGDLARYRAAKETIVRHQRAATPSSSTRTTHPQDSPRPLPPRSSSSRLERRVEHGAYLDPARGLVLAAGGEETALGHIVTRIPHRANAVAAAAIALTAGADADAIARGIETATLAAVARAPGGNARGAPGDRRRDGGDAGQGRSLARAASRPERHPRRGRAQPRGREPRACRARGAGAARGAPATRSPARRVSSSSSARPGRRLVPLLRAASRRRRRDQRPWTTQSTVAARHAAGARAVVFSPLFPVSLEDRARFAHLIERTR